VKQLPPQSFIVTPALFTKMEATTAEGLIPSIKRNTDSCAGTARGVTPLLSDGGDVQCSWYWGGRRGSDIAGPSVATLKDVPRGAGRIAAQMAAKMLFSSAEDKGKDGATKGLSKASTLCSSFVCETFFLFAHPLKLQNPDQSLAPGPGVSPRGGCGAPPSLGCDSAGPSVTTLKDVPRGAGGIAAQMALSPGPGVPPPGDCGAPPSQDKQEGSTTEVSSLSSSSLFETVFFFAHPL